MSACEEQQYVGDNSIDKNRQDLITEIHLSSRSNVAPSSEKNSSPVDEATVSNSAPQHKQLQRKRSVFSFNGFPNIQLLDQQLLKTRDTSVVHQDVSVPDNHHASNNFGSATGPNNSMITCRSTRLDDLGSTGSSRASSCDEPGMVAANRWACSPVIPSHSPNKLPRFGREGDLNSFSSNSSLESICSPTYQRDISPLKPIISAQATNGKATTSTTVISNDEQSGATIDQNQNVQIVGPNKGEYDETKQSTAPFESIRVKLKRNSMPDAQLIQRHIDNLISQNEAIISVDNWNNVSIRSYNSSKDSQATLIGKKANYNTPANNQQSNSSITPIQPKQSMRRVVQSRPQLLPSTTSILSTTSGFTSHDHSTNGYSAIHDSRDKGANFKLKQMIERKRSYNLAKLAPNFFPGFNSFTLDDSQLNLAHMSTLRHNFPRIEQLEPVELSRTFERYGVGKEPLENAIQNLCIKKRDDDSQYTKPTGNQDIKQYQLQPAPVSRIQGIQIDGQQQQLQQQQQQQRQSFLSNYTAEMKVRHESLPFKKRKISEPNMKC